MKKVSFLLLALQLCITSCATSQHTVYNTILKDRHPPFTVFAIGYWTPGYNIITLTDANHEYTIIKTRQNVSLKIGDTYQPETNIK